MLKHAWLAALLAAGSAGIWGAAQAETLDEALISAYSTNPTLLAERAKLRATDELVPQALSNWRPSVQVTGSAGPSTSTTRQTLPPPIGTYSQTVKDNASQIYGVSIVQPLYRGGRTVAQTRQAEAAVEAERATLASTEQSVLLNVVSAYLDVVQDQAIVDLTIKNEQVLKRQLDAVNDRFHVGEVTRTDVAQAESRLSAAHADRHQAEGNLRSARATYMTVVGHAPLALSAPTRLPALPVSSQAAQSEAEQNNPTLLNARYNYDAAEHGVDLIAGELLPSLSLNGTANKYYNNSGPNTSETVGTATVNLTIPIYQQGQEYSRLRAQKHTAGQARVTVDVAQRDTIEGVTHAWETLETARARIDAYSDQIKAAQTALEGLQRETQVGSRTVIDLLNAEQELLNAQINLVQAQHNETVAAYQLRSAVGGLTARALELPVEIYDPTTHYNDVRGQWVGTGISPDLRDQGK